MTSRERVLAALRHLEAPAPPEREVEPGLFQNFWGERYVYNQTPWGPMREDAKGALAGAQSLAELEAFDWPTPDCLDRSQLQTQCARYEQHALLYGFADVWQRPALVRGWEDMFVDMAERSEWVHFLSRKFTDFYLEDYTRAAEITNGRIDLFLLISDLGTQRGPLISLGMFREFVAPYLKEMIDHIHGLGARVLYHTCGTVRAFIPDLIELGIDVLDPIHGGMDMQNLLPSATPEEVEAEARRYCEVLGKDGGYILGPAHLFQPDVPPENILAVYRGAQQ